MARKKKHEEHENHERWLVSYADFITLLFAFFVVMYSISSVNEGKYRTLSHSLVAAFHSPSRSLEPVQVGELARSRRQAAMEINQTPRNMQLPRLMETPEDIRKEMNLPKGSSPKVGGEDNLSKMSKAIIEQLKPLIKDNVVTVRRTKSWLEVELNTSILFPSGSDQMAPHAAGILTRLGAILKPFPNPIRVEGFTDNVPISTSRFSSNWELSADRAAQVVELMAREGVDAARMSAVGFGEYRPIADNSTLEGRRKNRRVSVVVLAGEDTRYQIDISRNQTEVKLPADKAGDTPSAAAPGKPAQPGGGKP